ncbi:MAG TPA: LysM peptidoglycan-binding domain-containing protein, partial [Thermoanaerobaculia bacterium]|nr:LysM peptidoglycan-binding domain-containing protein [Thermoanaerobaculia bacterium]
MTLPVWAQAPTTTAKTTQKKTTATTTSAPAPAAAETMTTPATTSTTAPAVQKTTKKTRRTKKAAKATTAEKPAEKKPAAKTAAKSSTKSTHPPRELHKVGDHWTPYNPPDPSTYPANSKTYTIKAGDTLWALGKQFYGNSYLWPQLWEANTWITDAHWIYPGDVLLIEGEIAGTQTAATTTTTGTGAAVSGGTTAEAQQQTATGTSVGAPGEYHYRTAADAVGGTTGPVALASEAD